MNTRVCVASSFPESGNRNLSIVGDLASGFGAAVGAENVHCLPYLGLTTQVARLRPTLLVLVGSALRAQWDYSELARTCRSVGAIFAFWTVEDPYEFDTNYRFTGLADLVFSNDAWACRFYDRDRVHHLPTAASERLVRSLDGYADRSLEVFFCGVGFPNRRTLITDALPALERRRTLIVGENWPHHPGGILSNRRLPHADLIAHYAASFCVLNMGRTFSYANNRRSLPAVTPGPRTFEAAMVGCVQLYFQPSRFLADYFEPGREIIVFNTVDELGEELEQLLANSDAACEIARAAQARALAEHTYHARARTILAYAGLNFEQPNIRPVREPARPPSAPEQNVIPDKTKLVKPSTFGRAELTTVRDASHSTAPVARVSSKPPERELLTAAATDRAARSVPSGRQRHS